MKGNSRRCLRPARNGGLFQIDQLVSNVGPIMSKTAVINVIATFIAATSPSFAQIATAPPTPEWIAASGSVANQQTVFQRTFQVQGGLLKAILLGACEGEMSVEVNGALAGTIAGRERATGLDVTRMIHRGTNVLAIRARNAAGPARISVFLELNGDLARNSWVVTDSTWRSSVGDRNTPVQSLGRVDAEPNNNPFDPKKAFDA